METQERYQKWMDNLDKDNPLYLELLSIKEDLKEIYTNPYCITLDDLPFKQSSQQTYTEFPYVVEAENLKGAKGPETTINDQTIKGQYSGEGFVYLVGKTLTINVTVPEDGMYEFSARVAQIVSPSGRQQTISINKIDFKYSVPYTEEWIDFDNRLSNKFFHFFIF